MAVGFKVGPFFHILGSGDFLYCFFSNICFHLENKRWGSKFPLLMNNLHNGKLELKDIEKAKEELKDVEEQFLSMKSSIAIWNIDDVLEKAPWHNNLSVDVKNLRDIFMTSDGGNLFIKLYEAMDNAVELEKGIEVESM